MRSYSAKHHGITLPELLVTILITALISAVLVRFMIASGRLWSQCSSTSQAFPPSYSVLNNLNSDLYNAAYVQVPSLWAVGNSYVSGNLVVCRFDVVDTTDAQQRTKSVYEPYKCIQANVATATNGPSLTANTANWTKSYPWIIIYQPALDTDGSVLVPLTASMNGVVEYYLSDKTGTQGNLGTYLWQRTFNQKTDNTITQTSNILLAQNVTDMSFYSDKLSTQQVLSINSMALTVVGTDKQQSASDTFHFGIAFRNPAVANIPAMPTFP